jgi:hypothetical protein
MIVYPVEIQPYEDELGDMFIARCPDLPLEGCIGVERDDALSNAIERIQWVLVELYLAGKPMPICSPIPKGGCGVPAMLHWGP